MDKKKTSVKERKAISARIQKELMKNPRAKALIEKQK
jgi:hypothetical protein